MLRSFMYTDYRYSVEEHMMQGSISNFMYRVYGWMAAALSISAAVAYYTAHQPMLMKALQNSIFFFGIFIVQLGLVMALSFLLMRMSYGTAVILFMLYAASLGLTLSSIFLIYSINSIYLTFAVTAGMFGIMCLYGYFTKSDLTRIGNFFAMALIGLIIGFAINLYFQNAMADYVLSAVGVLVFTVLTAIDIQRIKQLGYQLLSHDEGMRKVAVLGALMLYLDFINLFLMLLRFFGNQRES